MVHPAADVLSHRLLEEISAFVHKQAAYGFIKLLIVKEDRLSAIQGYHRKVMSFVDAFQVCCQSSSECSIGRLIMLSI